MTGFLDAVATIRLYADAIGLVLLPVGFGLAGWFAWKAQKRERERRGFW